MRFSPIFCAMAVASLSGCAYFIPENPSAPRYSTVLGERHAPQLNAQMGKAATSGSLDSSAAPVSTIASADVPPPPAAGAENAVPSPFPPVDAATRAQAQAQLASAPVPESSQRRVPVENNTPQLAANAPDITSVPPRPPLTGEDSTEQQLNKVRAQLERDRAAADAARGKLSTDAAAEPSMLQGNGLAPLPPAVNSAPLGAPPAPTPMPLPTPAASRPDAAISPPVAAASNDGFIAPAPLMPPPPAPTAGMYPPPAAAPPTPMAVASAPLPASTALAPIMLRPPVQSAPSAQPSAAPRFEAPVEAAPSNLPPAVRGGFDPMASGTASGARGATAYAGSAGYLPANRYTR